MLLHFAQIVFIYYLCYNKAQQAKCKFTFPFPGGQESEIRMAAGLISFQALACLAKSYPPVVSSDAPPYTVISGLFSSSLVEICQIELEPILHPHFNLITPITSLKALPHIQPRCEVGQPERQHINPMIHSELQSNNKRQLGLAYLKEQNPPICNSVVLKGRIRVGRELLPKFTSLESLQVCRPQCFERLPQEQCVVGQEKRMG